jgi:glycosyltransferase involved in cell wall biosynthesis
VSDGVRACASGTSLRIGLDLVNLAGPGEGLGRFAGQLVRSLAGAATGHEFVIFLRDEMAGMFAGLPGNMRLSPVSLPRRRVLPWNQVAFRGGRRLRGLDILHSPVSVSPLAGAPGVRRVVTVHDLAFVFSPGASSPWSRAWWGFAWPRCLARAARVVTVSESTRRDVVSHYSVSPEKVTVIYPYVSFANEEVPTAAVRRVRQRYGLPPSYLLHVGAAHKRKNLETLVRAFAILKKSGPFACALVLAGPQGWDRGSALAEARRAGLGKDVILTGCVGDEDLRGLYAGAEALVFPSFYEGFGYPVVEAMACGTPVIASRASSLPEVAGGAALLVPPESAPAVAAAIREVLTSPGLAAKLRDAGRERVRRYSPERMAREYLAVYERAAEARPGGARAGREEREGGR